MYSLQDVKTVIRNPNLFLHELNRLWHTRLKQWDYNKRGIDIFDKDWDNMIILDACRYDMFKRQHDLPGQLESKISRGASTPEFLYANFHGNNLLDTVYVTSNPHLYRSRESYDINLHAVHNIWQEDGWDEEYGTVLPQTTTEHGKDAAEKYPNKRLIIHFMQPHYPFLTDSNEFYDLSQAISDTQSPDFWQELMRKNIDIPSEDIWRAYRENLGYVLKSVHELLEILNGKTVVTSDHGNMIGERARPFPIKEWGHPPGIYTDELVTVPWLVIECGERREITVEEPKSNSENIDEKTVEDRLEDLGYVA